MIYGNKFYKYNIVNENLNIDYKLIYDDSEKAKKVICGKLNAGYNKIADIIKKDKLSRPMIESKYIEITTLVDKPINYVYPERDDNQKFLYYRVPILYLHPEYYVMNVLKYVAKNRYNYDGGKTIHYEADYSKCSKSTITEFKNYCKRIYESLKGKLESSFDFIEVEIKFDNSAYKNSFESFSENRITHEIYFKIKDEFTAKLLELDKPYDSKIQKIIDKVSDKDKETIKRTYTQVIEWLLNPKTIDRRSSITFADILAVCNLTNINTSKLNTLSSKGKFKEISSSAFAPENQDYYKRTLGDDFKICEDLNTSSGDYVVFAKNKLWYINFEHDECDDINRYPYDTNNFTDYIYTNTDVIKAILQNYDFDKEYYLLSEAPKGSKPIL